MKKNELNTKLKAEIKKIKNDIESGLVIKLKELTAKLGAGTADLEKEIEKGSRKLAKKIAKELKLNQSAVAVTSPKIKAASAGESKTAKKPATAKVAPKTAPAKPVKEANVPAPNTITPKAPTPKAIKPKTTKSKS